jgi:hypothetical protein
LEIQVTGIKEEDQKAISEGDPGLRPKSLRANLNGSKKDWPRMEGETEVYGIRLIKDPGSTAELT